MKLIKKLIETKWDLQNTGFSPKGHRAATIIGTIRYSQPWSQHQEICFQHKSNIKRYVFNIKHWYKLDINNQSHLFLWCIKNASFSNVFSHTHMLTLLESLVLWSSQKRRWQCNIRIQQCVTLTRWFPILFCLLMSKCLRGPWLINVLYGLNGVSCIWGLTKLMTIILTLWSSMSLQ